SLLALARVVKFIQLIVSVEVALIFCADGLGLLEKGVMAMIAYAARKRVILRFGSGNLPAQCERHPALRWWLRRMLAMSHVVITQSETWSRYFGEFPEARNKTVSAGNGVQFASRPRVK